jgi:hypothetical protein
MVAAQSPLSQASSKVAQLEPGAPASAGTPPAFSAPAVFGAPPETSAGAPPTFSLAGAPAALGVVAPAPPWVLELPARLPFGRLASGVPLLPPFELPVPLAANAPLPPPAGASSGFWVVMPHAAMISAATSPVTFRVRIVAER